MEQVRARLFALAEEHGIAELHELAERTRRRYNGRASRKAVAPVTNDQRGDERP